VTSPLLVQAEGADGSIENWDGNQAKFGIDGDKDPEDPMNMLDQCKTTNEALAALEAFLKKIAAKDGEFDRGAIGLMGMQVKKGNKELPKEAWTPECQAKLTEVIQSLG